MKLTIAILSLSCMAALSGEVMVRVTSRFCGGPEEAGRTGFFFEIPIARARKLPEVWDFPTNMQRWARFVQANNHSE